MGALVGQESWWARRGVTRSVLPGWPGDHESIKSAVDTTNNYSDTNSNSDSNSHSQNHKDPAAVLPAEWPEGQTLQRDTPWWLRGTSTPGSQLPSLRSAKRSVRAAAAAA